MTAEYANEVEKTLGYSDPGEDGDTEVDFYTAGSQDKLKMSELKDLISVGDDGELKLSEPIFTAAGVDYDADDTDTQYGAQLVDTIASIDDVKDNFVITSNALYDASGKEISADKLATYFNEDGTMKEQLQAYNTSGELSDVGADQLASFATVTPATYADETSDVKKALKFNLHVGADSTNQNKIGVKIASMDSESLGVKGLKVDSEDAATKAIDTIASAISKVSEQRSALGAIQNRLEHTIANLDNVVENTTAAESRIRDTDMADEMVKYSKNNILQQAGQSMLAQANQSTQGVLSLLQ